MKNITRSKAIEHLRTIVIYSFQDGYTDEARQALYMAIKALEESKRKKGKWIDNTYCSECGFVNEVESGFIGPVNSFNFCPNCGADMRGENE